MSQASDIVLDGTPYMLAPGGYLRASAGAPEGRSGRVVIDDFVGGQRRAFRLERDTSWDSAGVGPAFGGQGVEPWPRVVGHTDAALLPVSAAQRVHALAFGDAIYVGSGRYLYRTAGLGSGAWSDLAQVADLGAGRVISGLGFHAGYIAIGCGGSRDIQLFDPGTLALTTFSAGLKASWLLGYAGRLVIADPTPGNENIVRLTTGGGLDSRELDSPIVTMALHLGKVAIATRSALWLLGGRSDPVDGIWIGEPEPAYSHLAAAADDFIFLCSFGGKLYTWLSGAVVEWNPNGGASRQGWRAAGLDGRRCFGAAVAGNALVVAIETHAGAAQLWAFDGTGWWLMRESDARTWVWPTALAGAGSYDLLAFVDGDAGVTYDLVRMVPRSPSLPAYAASGSLTTSLLDAGERDAIKQWRAIGATFATPEVRGNAGSTDPMTLELAWSIDGGANWTTAASVVVDDPAQRIIELEAGLPAAARSRFLQVRVSFASVTDWSPVLSAVWVDQLTLEGGPRRRRWSLSVLAHDGAVQRDGSLAPLDGQAQIGALWQAWEAGSIVVFRDVDYDLDPTERLVRVTGISERAVQPADRGTWGEAAIQLDVLEI